MAHAKAPAFNPGDPDATPFTRFDLGVLFPPNSIYGCAEIVLAHFAQDPTPHFLDELVSKGQVRGQYGVLPEATWFSILRTFLNYQSATREDVNRYQQLCLESLKIMTKRPHQEAWLNLRPFLLQHVDVLSGWSGSIQQELSERRGVFRGEDGNFYYNPFGMNEPVQILGARVTAEDRIDFITNQLVASGGFLRQFISLFSLFSIADDFVKQPNSYHRFIKAALPGTEFGSISCEWTFMHFDHSRTYRWRPSSNLCDPDWLIGDILGTLTDTLEVDSWYRPDTVLDIQKAWLEDGCAFQMDYVLDTTLSIGDALDAYVDFEGKIIRWINGTPERDATISVSVQNLQNHTVEDELLNRFLSLLVWEHGQHARIKWGTGGSRTPYSKAYSARRAGIMRVNPVYLHHPTKLTLTHDQRLALGLYREAQNSGSTFYEFLSYYKILELAVPGKGNRAQAEWLNKVAIPQLGHLNRLKEILALHSSLEEYLREAKVNGIKHAVKKTIDSDSPTDQLATTKDNSLMHEIAKLIMRVELKL